MDKSNQPDTSNVETVRIKMDDDTEVSLELTQDEIVRRSCGLFFTLPDGRIGRRIVKFTSVGGGEELTPASAWNKPHRSISAGVHPDQARAFTEAARRSGNTGVEYCQKTGQMISHSPGAMKKELKRRGMVNFGS